MNSGTLTIYSASAGSGKTFQLTRIYLTRLFRSRYNYRKILAVTFTNKATAEMKNRILDQLYRLANGQNSEYLNHLIKDTGRNEEEIRNEATELLFSVLHDFSRFSISTIDTFFQKVIRSFARETGLHYGFNVELDHSIILSLAIDKMIASSAEDIELKEWLTEYVLRNLESEKSWNLKVEITKLAEELFREKFKTLPENEKEKFKDKTFLRDYIQKIKSILSKIEEKTRKLGNELQDYYSRFDLSDNMFYQKSRGIPGFIRSLSEGKVVLPNNNVKLVLGDNPRWSAKDPSPQLINAINGGLHETLTEAITFCEKNFSVYHTALAVSANIYTLGILSDVLIQVRNVASDENSFLISDSGEMLSLITNGDQAPFIYEKTGNAYENYMIDEFQDTSFLQWKNFHPLILESMGRGCDNLIVGDIKQSIYRWRNSDWRILADLQNNKVDNERIFRKMLDYNWRSRSGIIRFNNTLFTVIPEQTDRYFTNEGFNSDFKNLYDGAIQSDPGKKEGGYIRLEFVEGTDLSGMDSKNSGKKKSRNVWKQNVLEKIPGIIETIQDHGYQASDIGIIVREGREGESVVRKMIDYSNGCSSEKQIKYNYNIVSDDSLALSSSYAVTFIIAVLKVLCDPEDMISHAEMLRFYTLLNKADNSVVVNLYNESLAEGTHGMFPGGYNQFLEKIRNRPLFEITENIISFFGLGEFSENVPYLETFQDEVLNFTLNRNSDCDTFLEWWETRGSRKSISLPANQNSARVLTIHKAKGLEFKVVILPFLSWNLDHAAGKQPVLWIRPEVSPFDEIEIVPVKYVKALTETHFEKDYFMEKYFSFIDNINLLYVAMTRAIDAIYGFIPQTSGNSVTVSSVLKNALGSDYNPAGSRGLILKKYYDMEGEVFEYGEIPGTPDIKESNETIKADAYRVNNKPESLRLRLHGINYLTSSGKDKLCKIDYGNLIHEAFEGINTIADVPDALNKLINEGKITETDYHSLEEKLNALLKSVEYRDWFSPGLRIMRESEILTSSGGTRRPDRVIIKDDRAIVIDYKSGKEHRHYSEQALEYGRLLSHMGYNIVELYLWYVDINKIVTVS